MLKTVRLIAHSLGKKNSFVPTAVRPIRCLGPGHLKKQPQKKQPQKCYNYTFFYFEFFNYYMNFIFLDISVQ